MLGKLSFHLWLVDNSERWLPAVSPGLAIVLIVVVWLLVLAPVILRSQRPMSRTGEAFDETRVLFTGDSDELAPRRNPKLAPASHHGVAATAEFRRAQVPQEELETVAVAAVEDRTESDAQGDFAKQTIFAAASRVKAAVGEGNTTRSTQQAHEAQQDAASASVPETIDGEVVAEIQVPIDEVSTSRVFTSQVSTAEVRSVSVVDEDDDLLLDEIPVVEVGAEQEDAAQDPPALSDDSGQDNNTTAGNRAVAFESGVFTSPITHELADDAYYLDDGYISAVDLMYPGAVDAEFEDTEDYREDSDSSIEASPEAGAAVPDKAQEVTDDSADDITDGFADESTDSAGGTELQAVAEPGVGDELTPEELEFAQSRVGRGGWDPEADAVAKATRYQRRQRTLVGLAAAAVLTVALGVLAGGGWWAPAVVVGILTVAYLVALRAQVRKEQQLRTRRVAQLRRARLGVRSAADEELAIPRSLRRPGAFIVELDDDSPDFEHLPYVGDGTYAPDPTTNRVQRRDDLAARRVG